jgi:hypothetical protein
LTTWKWRKQLAGKCWRLPWLWQEIPYPFRTVSAWIFAIVLLFGVVMTARHPQPSLSAPTGQQKKNEDPSLFRVANGAISLRNAALNPNSFVLDEVVGMADGAFCYSYRGQNEFFGGINRGHAVLPRKASKLDQSDAAWRHYCANKIGADLTDSVKAMLQLVH